MKKTTFTLLSMLLFSAILAQESKKDSLQPIQMQEVIVIGNKAQLASKQFKILTSIDDYLQKSTKIEDDQTRRICLGTANQFVPPNER
jgi:iron complex outermembrane receptor protein